MDGLRQDIHRLANELGLVFLGIVDLDVRQDFERFEAWLRQGRHGALSYMENHQHLRERPGSLLDGAQAALILALPYRLADAQGGPAIAGYARIPDYHKIFWRRGEELMRRLG